MATTIPDTTEIKIAVPKAYRDYIAGAQNKLWLFMLCAYAAVTYLWNIFLKHRWHFSYVDMIIGAGLFYWLYHRQKPWHYKVSDQRITLPNLNGGGWPWLWKEVSWSDDIAETVEWQWGDLPGILFKMKDGDELLMVYSPEEAEAVRQQVLPVSERFILPERQEYWAERWRTS